MTRNAKALGSFFEVENQSPLAHDRSAGPQIFEALKKAILSMEIAPGSMMSEGDIARRFSASRTPVREALAQLRNIGLVITKLGHGNFVTKLSETQIREARFIREILETGAIRSICEVGIEKKHEIAIVDNLKLQKICVAEGNKYEFRDLDDQFHGKLALATGYPRMAHILEREKMALDRVRVLSLADSVHVQNLYEQHVAIFEAVLDRDSALAGKTMKAHLTSVLSTLSELAEDHSEYFE